MKAPKPQEHFSAESKAFWQSVNADYELDIDAQLILRAACENWDRAQEARQLIARDGLVLNGRRHPAIDIEKQCYGLFLRSMRQLGLDIVAPNSGKPFGKRV